MADTFWRPISLYEMDVYVANRATAAAATFTLDNIVKSSSLIMDPIQQQKSDGTMIDIAYKFNFNLVYSANAFGAAGLTLVNSLITDGDVTRFVFTLQAEIGAENVVIDTNNFTTILGMGINISIGNDSEYNLIKFSGSLLIPKDELANAFDNNNW